MSRLTHFLGEILPLVYAVSHVMSRPLITVDVESYAHDAMKLMAEKDIGAVGVTEKGEPVGIVTERDVLKKCCLGASCMKVKVREIMSRPLVTTDAETPISEAMKVMIDKNIRRLPVTEKGEIVGIVTQEDLMRGTLTVLSTLTGTLTQGLLLATLKRRELGKEVTNQA